MGHAVASDRVIIYDTDGDHRANHDWRAEMMSANPRLAWLRRSFRQVASICPPVLK
jgi:hypothetical protein